MATAAADLFRLTNCCDRHGSALTFTSWARTHLWLNLCYHCTNQHTDALVLAGWVCERQDHPCLTPT